MKPTLPDLTSIGARIRDDDAEAFRLFFQLQYTDIFHFLLRYTNRREIAEDLTQDTFVRFWNARHSLDDSRSIRGYAFTIARNLALNHLERERIFQHPVLLTETIADRLTHDPEESYARGLLMDEFQLAIAQLPERCRAVFILSRFHDLRYDEIAETLDISLQTVKNQMNKAIATLRSLLAHHCE